MKKHTMKKTHLAIALMVFCISLANAAPVTLPSTFTADTPAVAAEVNGNFDSVKAAVDDNDSRVTTNAEDVASIIASISSLHAKTNSLEAANTALEARAKALETDKAILQNLISNVVPYLTGGTDAQGQPTVFFSGVNVHVNNGEGATSTVDGTGNLIVGYDEESSGTLNAFCTAVDSVSENAYTTLTECQNNGGVWGTNTQKTGSHNVVIGSNNYTQYGSIVTGTDNTANGIRSNVIGGYNNNAGGKYSSISGGQYNVASGSSSAITGGVANTASGVESSVSGGSGNHASGLRSSISGGFQNTASGSVSSISGGLRNTTAGDYGSVSGGADRNAPGEADWAAGTQFENF